MKKLSMLIASAGLLVVAGTAKAQTTVANFLLNPSIDSSTGLPVQGASGTYRVIVDVLANVYTVTITGINDGNAPPPGNPILAGNPGTGKAGVNLLSFIFQGGG